MTADTPIIASKLTPPRLQRKTVPRTRLLARLHEASHLRLLVLAASAGFGKTTLLGQWRQQCLKDGADVAWLQLGPAEAQLQAFRPYFVAALAHAGIDGLPTDATSGAIANRLLAHQRELYLVVDDYQHVGDAAVHAFILQLLEQAPDNFHLAIATRKRLPMPLGQLLGRGMVLELAAGELPFDREEIVQFMASHVDKQRDSDDVRTLVERTAGWPAALQILASELRRPSRSRTQLNVLAAPSGDLGRYLNEDVLSALASPLVELLETLSCCARFDAGLAAALTGRDDAGALLATLETDLLFIARIEHGEERTWLRLHPLFNDFLALRRTRHGEAWEQQVNIRASRWFASQSLVQEAVRHARLARDLAFAIDVVNQAAHELHSLTHLGSLLRWVEDVPADIVAANENLTRMACWANLLTGHLDLAEHWCGVLGTQGAGPGSDELAVIRAGIAMGRDDTAAVAAVLAPLGTRLPANPILASFVVAEWNACHSAAGDIGAAHAQHERWQATRLGAVLDDHAILATTSLFAATLTEGDPRFVERAGPALLARAEAAHGAGSTCAAVCAIWLAIAHYESNRVAEAAALLDKRNANLAFVSPTTLIRLAILQAQLAWLEHDAHGALAILAREEARCRANGLARGVAMVRAAQARIYLARGDARAAHAIQEELNQLSVAHTSSSGWLAHIPAIAAIAAARLALARHDGQRALSELDGVRRREIDRNNATLVIAHLLAAQALQLLGRDDEAQAANSQARLGASQLGLQRTVLNEHTEAVAAAPPVPARQAAPAAITGREAQILGLLAQSMSNKRIALTLNLGVDTIKKNLRQIYTKIGVSSRYDALTWAREHGIVARA